MENMLKLIVEKLETMESKIDKLETGQQEIKEDLKVINKKLDNIFEQVVGNTEKLNELKQDTTDIKEDIEFNWLKQKETEKEIYRIKQKISSRL